MHDAARHDAEPFRLRNDPPKPKKNVFAGHGGIRQISLFMGLNDLPGQTYLIPEQETEDQRNARDI